MDKIYEIEQKALKETGIKVNNISHWDSSPLFQYQMNKVLVLPKEISPWNYNYSYSIPESHRKKLLLTLGTISSLNTVPIVFPSSTISIVNVLNLLSKLGKKKLCILQPSYFSIAPCCKQFGISYDTEYITFDINGMHIPFEEIVQNKYDCVWITNPIYSSGLILDKQCIEQLLLIRENGIMLIFDESLMIPGYEVARHIDFDPHTIAIYSPHKAISMNGIKFSVILCNNCHEDFFDHWIDVFSGGLASSNIVALYHYLSDNYYSGCYMQYKSYTEKLFYDIKKITASFSSVYTYPKCVGHYMNIFTSKHFNNIEQLINFIENINFRFHTSIIPGIASGYNKNSSFNFRINLTGDSERLPHDLYKVLEQITKN